MGRRGGHTRHHACAELGCGIPDYISQRNLREAAADAILKSDPLSPSLNVSGRRQPDLRAPSLLFARTWRTRRLAGGTREGDAAGSAHGLLCCHLASPCGVPALAPSPRGGAGHSGTQRSRARARVAEVTPARWGSPRAVPCRHRATAAGDGARRRAGE